MMKCRRDCLKTNCSEMNVPVRVWVEVQLKCFSGETGETP